jgi:hypothetical protein
LVSHLSLQHVIFGILRRKRPFGILDEWCSVAGVTQVWQLCLPHYTYYVHPDFFYKDIILSNYRVLTIYFISSYPHCYLKKLQSFTCSLTSFWFFPDCQ